MPELSSREQVVSCSTSIDPTQRTRFNESFTAEKNHALIRMVTETEVSREALAVSSDDKAIVGAGYAFGHQA